MCQFYCIITLVTFYSILFPHHHQWTLNSEPDGLTMFNCPQHIKCFCHYSMSGLYIIMYFLSLTETQTTIHNSFTIHSQLELDSSDHRSCLLCLCIFLGFLQQKINICQKSMKLSCILVLWIKVLVK